MIRNTKTIVTGLLLLLILCMSFVPVFADQVEEEQAVLIAAEYRTAINVLNSSISAVEDSCMREPGSEACIAALSTINQNIASVNSQANRLTIRPGINLNSIYNILRSRPDQESSYSRARVVFGQYVDKINPVMIEKYDMPVSN